MATASLTVRILADLDSFKRGMSDAEREMQKTGARLQSLGQSMTVGITLPFIALGAALAKSAADDEASVNKLARTFGTAATSMEGFIQNLMKTVPATDDELRNLTSTTDTLLRSIGLGAPKATELTKAVTTLAGDLAAYNKVELSVAQNALEKALAGKTKGLAEFGIVINEADIKNRAYSLGLAKTGQELTHSATAQAAWSLILDKSKIQQGEAARTIGDASNAMARLRQASDSAADSFGAVFLPTAAKVVDTISKILKGMADLDPTTKNVIVGFGGVVAAIGPAIFVIGGLTEKIILLNRALTVMSGTTALAGLGKIATSFGPWALLIGGALYAITKDFEAQAEKAKIAADAIDLYKTSLNDIATGKNGAAALKAQADALNGMLAALQGRRSSLEQQRTAAGATKQPFDNALTRAVPNDTVASINAQIETVDKQIAALQPLIDATKASMKGLAVATAGAGDDTKTLAEQFKEVEARANAIITTFDLMSKGLAPVPGIAVDAAGSLGAIQAIINQIKDPFDPMRVSAEQLAITLRDKVLTQIDAIASRGAGFLPVAGPIPSSAPLVGKPTPGEVNINFGSSLGLGDKNGGINIKAPEIAQIPPVMSTGFSSIREATHAGFENVAATVGQTLYQTLGRLIGGNGSIGSQIGGGLLGAFGGGIGGYFGNMARGAIGGVLGAGVGSVIPVVGTLIGGALGSAIGGLFSHHKKATEDSANALDTLAKTVDKVTESITNVPAFFKAQTYRSEAAPFVYIAPPPPPTSYPYPNLPPSGTTPTTPSDPTDPGHRGGENNVIHVHGNVVLQNATNPDDFIRQLSARVLRSRSTGNAGRIALAGIG